MSRRFGFIAILLAIASLGAAALPITQAPASATPVVVHEWGTFASVAGADGQAVDWQPFDGSQDLPCFVERFKYGCVKCEVTSKVRMETPVLYFYAHENASMRVRVGFHQGAISEWYPHAVVDPITVDPAKVRSPSFRSQADWGEVKILPGAAETYPIDQAGGHYFIARHTDASPIEASGQREKFLFYRGVGTFEPPIRAMVSSTGAIDVQSPAGAPLGDVIFFENRGGAMGYAIKHADGSQVAFEPLALEGDLAPPTAELEHLLVERGLYAKEAKAMVDTWRDSWFTEGARLFYFAPRTMIDSTLPLDLQPAPAELVRAFVGRVELFTPATSRDLTQAIWNWDATTINAYGRFVLPMLDRLLEGKTPSEQSGPRTAVLRLRTLNASAIASASCR